MAAAAQDSTEVARPTTVGDPLRGRYGVRTYPAGNATALVPATTDADTDKTRRIKPCPRDSQPTAR